MAKGAGGMWVKMLQNTAVQVNQVGDTPVTSREGAGGAIYRLYCYLSCHWKQESPTVTTLAVPYVQNEVSLGSSYHFYQESLAART